MKQAAFIDSLAENLGFSIRTSVETIGGMSMFLIRAVWVRWHIPLIMEQMYVLGVQSIPLVLFISCFVGFISTLSMASITGGLALSYLGTAVFKAVISEMGPTFTGLILAARMGSKISAELGSMRVSEQIDALTTLCLDPMRYAVSPRIIASTLMGPVVYILGCTVAIVGAQVLATLAMGLAPAIFYNSMKLLFSFDLIIMGLLKSTVFGLLIGLSASYCGFYTIAAQGAIGVGISIRRAVVMASLAILLANILITSMFV